jgi:hypothetical protein
MKERILAALLFGALFCGCYRHTKTDPSSVQIESPFEECSFYTSWLPAEVALTIKDSKLALLDITPDLSTAILTSAKGVRYPLRLYPERIFHSGGGGLNAKVKAKKVESPEVRYLFSVMQPDLPDQKLDCLPAGSFKFSVTFTGPTGAKNISIAFKRSTRLQAYEIGH